MEYLNSLSSDVIEIYIIYKNLNILSDLSRFIYLQKLDCSHNRLIRLNNLPPSLLKLDCSYNQLTQLDNLSSCVNLLS